MLFFGAAKSMRLPVDAEREIHVGGCTRTTSEREREGEKARSEYVAIDVIYIRKGCCVMHTAHLLMILGVALLLFMRFYTVI